MNGAIKNQENQSTNPLNYLPLKFKDQTYIQ